MDSTDVLMNCYTSFINLDSRPDRLVRMEAELKRIGLSAARTRGILPHEVRVSQEKVAVMQNRTPGAIGCHYSQISIMAQAYFHGWNAFVMEDDLIFCSDFHARMKHAVKFLSENEWDVFWLGGTYHKQPTWHRSINGKHTHPDLQMCHCGLNKDWEPTTDEKIVRTYGIWSTYAYIVNYNSILKILKLLDDNVHLSMGIDWLFILLQPQLNTFAYNPGMVKQYDNQSNIGNGITKFSNFEFACGKHWFADKI